MTQKTNNIIALEKMIQEYGKKLNDVISAIDNARIMAATLKDDKAVFLLNVAEDLIRRILRQHHGVPQF